MFRLHCSIGIHLNSTESVAPGFLIDMTNSQSEIRSDVAETQMKLFLCYDVPKT